MQPDNREQHKPRSKRRPRRMGIIILVLLLLAAISASAWLFIKYREAIEANPKTDEQRTIQQVADIIEAPDEQPSVVTVLDASKLANKDLAERARDDDKLLVYAEHKRVVIFRPSSGKIVDMLTIRDAVPGATNDDAVKTE